MINFEVNVRSLGLMMVAGLCLLPVACNGREKVDECNLLVGVVNVGVEKVVQLTQAAPQGGSAIAELRGLAEEMDAIAIEAKALKLSIPELKGFSGEYQAMAAEVAGAARELAAAVDKVDQERMTAAEKRMAEAVQPEAALIDGMNKFCRAQ